MSAFLSGLLGRKAPEPKSVAAVETEYDTVPRLKVPAGLPVEPTPGPTAEEQQAIGAINLQRSELLKDLPTEPDDGSPKFNAAEWLTEQRILIYLRASKGNREHAAKRLRDTLEWRCTYRPHAITPEEMREEGATGKQYVNGFDVGGRPVIYMYSHRENTKNAEGQLRWVVFTMEQAIRSMPEGVTKATMVIDVSQYSMSQAVPLSTAREFLRILESHYPERLHMALILSPPAYFVMFYRIVAPFIDNVTKAKIAFVDVAGNKGKPLMPADASKSDSTWVDIRHYIAPDQLQSDAGGEWPFKFQQDAYWLKLEQCYQDSLRIDASA
ncbi:hypothetical protein H4R20_000439 [Coemansia guatemalensis]|uniref:CRAL-TRIO domain-containing protein n=1 Tax=Coemansia guatemalensis TaxID=2761395 RepID=A0A9W8HZ70_9FUNG|nr:hypothetical protein H4R20_000439 [Coemansia guatemalensis]